MRPSSSTPENGRFRETIKLSASAGGWKKVASPTEVAEGGDSMASKTQRAIVRGPSYGLALAIDKATEAVACKAG